MVNAIAKLVLFLSFLWNKYKLNILIGILTTFVYLAVIYMLSPFFLFVMLFCLYLIFTWNPVVVFLIASFLVIIYFNWREFSGYLKK